ncbi:MAG: SHOCT domain-containing protein [Acidobacteria bacterium]|nr:SHOCT domain-containing protein [Acidobacteriota bacterium]
MPLLDLFWSMLWFFMFFLWIWLLIMIFADIFRSEISGWGKAGWVLFVIILPFLGVLIYLIANGDDMQNRSMQQALDAQNAQREYIQSVAGGGSSSADEIEKLASLRDSGHITNEEFQAQKAKLLA